MGIDAFIYCKTCTMHESLGRAYNFKEEMINKKLDKDLMEELEIIIKRFELSLWKTIFSDSFIVEYYPELIGFYREHKEHDLWLLNDFGKEAIKERET